MFLFPTDIPRVTLPLTRFCLNQNKRHLATHSAALLAPCFAFCLVSRFCSPSGTASIPFLHRFLARPASRSCLFGTLSCSPFGTPFAARLATHTAALLALYFPFCLVPGFCSPSGKLSCSLQPVWRLFNSPFWAPIWPATYTSSLASDLLHLSLPVCLWRIIKRREAGRRSKGRVEGGCIPWRAQPGFH